MITPSPTYAGSPLRLVLTIIEDGASSLPEIAARSGLDAGVVTLAIERLVASGHLTSERLLGCPDDGCGSCPSAREGRPTCDAASPRGPAAGPVLVTLGPMRR